jgi:hypothetical protein
MIVFAAVLATWSFCARAELPKSLSIALEEHGCVDAPVEAGPKPLTRGWWVSLAPHTGSTSDYAFMCQAKSDALYTRLVVHVLGEHNPWGSCDKVVDAWKDRSRPWFPLNVEVVRAKTRFTDTSLGKWWQVTDQGSSEVVYGPPTAELPDLILDTSAQDNGSAFACHSGRWYRRGID